MTLFVSAEANQRSANRPSERATCEVQSRLLRAGLLTGVVDGLFSSALSVLAHESTVTWLFQGVAGVLLGAKALDGGAPVAALGVAMHFGVAFGWSAAFLLLALRWSWIRRLLASPHGVAKVAAIYGPFVWAAMSLALIPVLTQRPPTIGLRWWVQLIGHIPFVGLPIVASCAPGAPSGFLSRGRADRR